MKTKSICLFFLGCVLVFTMDAAAQSNAFTYQGRLLSSGAVAEGLFDVRFTLFAAETNGTATAGPVTNQNVTATSGLFTTMVDFGTNIYDGTPYWLELAVRPAATADGFTALAPRQALTPVPYALHTPRAKRADKAKAVEPAAVDTAALADASVTEAKLVNRGITSTKIAIGAVTADELSGNAITTDKIADGSIVADDLNLDLLGMTFWRLGGNTGLAPGTHFLGTTDNQPLEFRVNGQRVLRLEDNGDSGDPDAFPDGAPNILGGSHSNFISSGIVGATIVGGGATNYSGFSRINSIRSDFGTIGGGLANRILSSSTASTIAGGLLNRIGAQAQYAVVGGGANNSISTNSHYAIVAGGFLNDIGSNAFNSVVSGGGDNNIAADARYGTIAGGSFNNIGVNAWYGTIGGGINNTVTDFAQYATIAGGFQNTAATRSYAAGTRAKATHDGAFVWADSQNADFASTSTNQFNVRASGGARFETSGSGLVVDGQPVVAGQVSAAQIADGAGSGLDTDLLDGLDSSAFWKLGGNAGTTAGTHFLGTTDGEPLELKVNTVRALRLEPTGTTPNLIGGYSGNSAAAGVDGSVIGGGGSSSGANQVAADYTTIGGGLAHGIQTTAHYATVSGGRQNTIQTNAQYGAIGGGYLNTISHDSLYSVVDGGYRNLIVSNTLYATIGGGRDNTNGPLAHYSSINGGFGNTIHDNAQASIIAGGIGNTVSNDSQYSTISGGYSNRILAAAFYATIAGGTANTNGHGAHYSTTGGGWQNHIRSNAQSSVVAGGYRNVINNNSSYGVIAGGQNNVIDGQAWYAAVSSGISNRVSSYYSSIGGGAQNSIQANTGYGSIGGGQRNAIQGASQYATIGGGRLNNNSASDATISGGSQNSIATDSSSASIGGGLGNTISAGAIRATIGGGSQNEIEADADYATIPGGNGARANNYGQFAYAGGLGGGAQTSLYVLSGGTLGLATNELTLGLGRRMTIPNESTWVFDVLVVGRSSPTSQTLSSDYSAGYQLRGVVENNAGAVAFVGTPTVTILAEDIAAWNVFIEADVASSALIIKATSNITFPNNEFVKWVATVRTVEVIQ